MITKTIQCLYCGENGTKRNWFSEWSREHHYKCFNCAGCGKKNYLHVTFTGSGHDNVADLEHRIA